MDADAQDNSGDHEQSADREQYPSPSANQTGLVSLAGQVGLPRLRVVGGRLSPVTLPFEADRSR